MVDIIRWENKSCNSVDGVGRVNVNKGKKYQSSMVVSNH